MSDAYLASDGIDDYVQLTSPIVIDANQDFRIEIDCQALDGADFGVRFLGNMGNDTGRFIAWKGRNAQFGPLGSVVSGAYNSNLLKRQLIGWQRQGITHTVDVDGNSLPGTFTNGTGFSFGLLLTQNSVTNARNPLHLYGMRVYKDGILTNNWEPVASAGAGNILYDTVGGNHGTLVNFETDGSQWRVGDPVSEVLLTVGPSGTYATLEDAFAVIPTDLITANTKYLIEIEDNGSFYSPVSNSIILSGITTDDTRNVRIKAKAGSEYNPATGNGVKIIGNSPFFFVLALNTSFSKVENCYIESTAGTPAYALGGSGAYSSAINCYLKTPRTASGKPLAPTGRDFIAKNCILDGGEWSVDINNWTYNSAVIDCTAINPLTAMIRKGASGCTPIVQDTLHYGTGQLALISTGWNAGCRNNATSEVTPANTLGGTLTTGVTDANFIDYAAGDYRILDTSPVGLLGIGAFREEGAVGGSLTVNLSYISPTSSLGNPTVTKDKLITLPEFPSVSSVPQPSVLMDKLISLPVITSGSSVHSPSLLTELLIAPGTIGSTALVRSLVLLKDKLIALQYKASTSSVYTQELRFPKNISLQGIEATEVMYLMEVIGGYRPLPDVKLYSAEGYGLHLRSAQELKEVIIALIKRIEILEGR